MNSPSNSGKCALLPPFKEAGGTEAVYPKKERKKKRKKERQ
jgi:hypothetical protein